MQRRNRTSPSKKANYFLPPAFSIQGYRMNQVMKTLTIVATIFIPLTFIAGIYGMNFRYMPELEWQYGYAMVWGTFALIFAGMVFYLKKKKWF